MLKLPPYIFCQSPELPGAGFILQTAFPHYLGKVWIFKTEDELAAFLANRPPAVGGKVNGFRVIVEGVGNLHNPTPKAYHNQNAETLARIYREMADYFFKSKIETNASYYRRYAE